LETLVPSLAHWSTDGWRTTHDTPAEDRGLGEYVIDLPTETLPAGTQIDFTFYWPEVKRWEQTDFRVEVQLAGRDDPKRARDTINR
jgi:glucoamylase